MDHYWIEKKANRNYMVEKRSYTPYTPQPQQCDLPKIPHTKNKIQHPTQLKNTITHNQTTVDHILQCLRETNLLKKI